MLDMHVLTDGGSVTALAAVATIPALDGASAAGVPIRPGATLIGWGHLSTIADTIWGMQLLSQDQVDSINGKLYNPGAASLFGIAHFDEYLPYVSGSRAITAGQNTGAANCLAYLIDKYPQPSGAIPSSLANGILLPQLFGVALVAITWGAQVVAPAINIPVGSYAILGAWVHDMTNYGIIRFQHASFQGLSPGFPVVDNMLASARALHPSGSKVFDHPGYQFVELGDVPVFQATSTGSGLTIQMNSITICTPNVILNLLKVA